MAIGINIKVVNIAGGGKGGINNFFSSIKRQAGRPGQINNFDCVIDEQLFTPEKPQSKKPRQEKKGNK